MTSGGARNRSGPAPDPTSGRAERRGQFGVLEELPAAGYTGTPPEFPLPKVVVIFEYFEDRKKQREHDADASETRHRRELELWRTAWKTPQAAAWARESWRWHTIAMWVRTAALCETPEASAADKGSLHRFADQIGMTPAGLRENGWKIAADELAPRRAAPEQPAAADVRGRLRSVPRAAGA